MGFVKYRTSKLLFGICGTVALSMLSLVEMTKETKAEPALLALGTSSTGSGPYRWGVALANVTNKGQSDFKISAQSTLNCKVSTNLGAIHTAKSEIK